MILWIRRHLGFGVGPRRVEDSARENHLNHQQQKWRQYRHGRERTRAVRIDRDGDRALRARGRFCP